jgi:hypothetical protein
MRSLPTGWNTILAKLGFRRLKKKRNVGSNPLARRLRLESLEDRRVLAITVNTGVDEQDFSISDGDISLRDAIYHASAGETINFASSLNNATIGLSHLLGHIEIERSVTIDGTGRNITINGNDPTSGRTGHGIRLFNITDLTIGGAPPLVTFVGLTMTGSDVNNSSLSGLGGAIRSEARLVIRDCILLENEADAGGAIYVNVAGGGATVREVLRIENSIIDDNDAATGGGIQVDSYGAVRNDRVVIVSSIIADNRAFSGGGLFAQLEYTDLTVTDTQFEFNRAQSSNNGGGIYLISHFSSNVLISQSSFYQNDALQAGGGMYAVVTEGAQLTIRDTVFEDNNAARGGGLSVDVHNASAVLEDNLFDNNDAIYSSLNANGDGGGARITIVADTGKEASVEISNNIFTNNESQASGGGLFAQVGGLQTFQRGHVDLKISDSQFMHNHATYGGGLRADVPAGGHMALSNSDFVMTRSVVKDNTAADKGGGVFVAVNSGSTAAIQESVITGNKAGLALLKPSLHPNSRLYNAGGGIYAYIFGGEEAGKFTVTGSEISHNTAGQHGGGLAIFSKREDTDSGIAQFGISNSTISGNKVEHQTTQTVVRTGGGVHLGIWNNGIDGDEGEEALHAQLRNVTITNNVADVGGGIYSLVPQHPERRMDVRLTNSIISGNWTHDTNPNPNNFYGSINAAETKYNLFGWHTTIAANRFFDHDDSATPYFEEIAFSALGAGNLNNAGNNPQLANLANNGGLTRTHRPLNNSPVIDKGLNSLAIVPFTSDILTTDQRGAGFPRRYDVTAVSPAGLIVDIGAHEVGMAKVVDVILDNSTWGRDPHSFAETVPLGEQLRPFATQGVNTIQIVFSDAVLKKPANGGSPVAIGSGAAEGDLLMELNRTRVDANNLTLTERVLCTDFSFNTTTNTATWTFAPTADGGVLLDGKYSIHLKAPAGGVAGVVDSGGFDLDAEWTNDPGTITVGTEVRSTWDDYTDDPKRPFKTGDAQANGGGLRFHFALLAGDYDGDGLVERDSESATGDGNGDGLVNSLDATIGTLGKRLPLKKIIGVDFNDDEIVGYQDLLIWQTSWGIDDDGDATGDGETDGLDFMRWLTAFSNTSAWYIGSTPITAALIGDAAPQVMNVIVSGSLSAHAPFSFDTVDGSGSQLATVPVGLADTISIVFSENVNVSESSLLALGLTTATVPTLAEFDYDPLTFTATWRFEGWVLGDNYLLYLADSVTDTEGNFLDGEWTNPQSVTTTNSLVSEFPSGNGDPGGAFAFAMTLLSGDMNLDAAVDNTDYDLFITSLMQGGGTLFVHGDFNGSGHVSAMDIAHFTNNWPTNLQNLFILADLDQDGDVDDNDLIVIYNNYGSTSADWEDGDLNGDSVVDELDVDLAFAQFGTWLLDMVA